MERFLYRLIQILEENAARVLKALGLIFDNVPTEGSTHLVNSGGVYAALDASMCVPIEQHPELLTVNDRSHPMIPIESELGCTLDDLVKVGYARFGNDDSFVYFTVVASLYVQAGAYSGIISFITGEKNIYVLEINKGYLVERALIKLANPDATLMQHSTRPIQNAAVYNALTNYYLKSETYTKSEVQTLISAISQFKYELANSLPTASAETMGIIYLIPSVSQSPNNIKDEYITIESGGVYSWEQIGSTEIDLSDYVTTTALNTALAAYTTTAVLNQLLAAKQDTLTFDNTPTAGSNNPVKSSGIKAAIDLVESHTEGKISTAISDLTLMSDAQSIQSASGIYQDQAAEALGISEDELRLLLNGGYLSFVYKSPWYGEGTGDFIYNRLVVTKVDVKLRYGMPNVTVVLGYNDIVITFDGESIYSITVNP